MCPVCAPKRTPSGSNRTCLGREFRKHRHQHGGAIFQFWAVGLLGDGRRCVSSSEWRTRTCGIFFPLILGILEGLFPLRSRGLCVKKCLPLFYSRKWRARVFFKDAWKLLGGKERGLRWHAKQISGVLRVQFSALHRLAGSLSIIEKPVGHFSKTDPHFPPTPGLLWPLSQKKMCQT